MKYAKASALLLLLLLSSCSKPSAAPIAASSVRQTEIHIEDALTEQGCLSLPKLFSALSAVDPKLPVLLLPKEIKFESEFSIRENFRRLISYGQLEISQRPFEFIQSLPIAVQNNCTDLLLRDPDGTVKTYQIHEATRTSLSASAEDGEIIRYEWLSPRSILSERRYQAFDLPCRSEREPIFVTIKKLLDWREAKIPATLLSPDSAPAIDPAFLQLAADSVGDDPASLYIDSPEGRRIDLQKLISMAEKPPLPQIISCDGSGGPPPAPIPEPIPSPTPPDDDEGFGPRH